MIFHLPLWRLPCSVPWSMMKVEKKSCTKWNTIPESNLNLSRLKIASKMLNWEQKTYHMQLFTSYIHKGSLCDVTSKQLHVICFLFSIQHWWDDCTLLPQNRTFITQQDKFTLQCNRFAKCILCPFSTQVPIKCIVVTYPDRYENNNYNNVLLDAKHKDISASCSTVKTVV